MPDMEKLVDDFRVHVAKTPEEKARAIGFNEGKSYARKEILAWFVFWTVIAGIIGWPFV